LVLGEVTEPIAIEDKCPNDQCNGRSRPVMLRKVYNTQFIYSNCDAYIAIALCSKLLHSLVQLLK
jgi:hypothetical protein